MCLGNLNKSIDSKFSVRSKNSFSSSKIVKPVLNKSRNISPRDLERKKFIFNKEIENIDSELRKLNQAVIDMNNCVYYNNDKYEEINNIPIILNEYEKEFSKIVEKVYKIKELVFKNYLQKRELYHSYKINNQQKLVVLKQNIEIFNNNLEKCKFIFMNLKFNLFIYN